MNFYNPYYFGYPVRTSLFGNFFKRFNFASIMSGTQKTLNTVNQIIPIVKQAKPMMDNAKTMFKLMSEFNRNDEPKISEKKATSTEVALDSYNGGPTFFQ